MSEAWIRVYAADMRGDPDLAIIGLAGQALLIHAWDLAKNSPVFGEMRMKNGEPFTAETFQKIVPGATKSIVKKWWTTILDYGYAELRNDALYFPKLARRQAYDPTNAVRQARLRGRTVTPPVTAEVTAEVTAPRTPEVTAQNQESIVQKEQGQPETPRSNPVIDHQNQNDEIHQPLPPAITTAIHRLLDDLPDSTAGTLGRLVNLAKRGATEADFHDARQGWRAASDIGSPARYACRIVENHVIARTSRPKEPPTRSLAAAIFTPTNDQEENL